MTKIFNYNLSTEIVYGCGVSVQTGTLVKNLGCARVLIVTDPIIAKIGLLDGIVQSLKSSSIEAIVFSQVEENPQDTTVEKAYQLYAKNNCMGVIGVGGGSSMDAAKGVGVLATNPGPLSNYWGLNKVPNQPGLVIAIPTTAGTGAEVTIFAVINESQKDMKNVVGGKNMAPTLAICDPLLSVSLPPFSTAITGMDALSHALECYTNTATNPISQTLAYRAMELIGQNLRAAVANGNNVAARDNMLMGSLLAGMSFNVTRLGLSHSYAMPLGSWENGLAHGLANAIMLPRVTEFNIMANYEAYAQVAKALGEDIICLTMRQAAALAVKALDELIKDIGIPSTLSAVGIKKENIPSIAQEAMKSGNTLVNPRQANLEDVIAILEAAM